MSNNSMILEPPASQVKPERHGQPWTRAETLAVFNQYWHIPYGRLHSKNQEIIALADLIGRTSGSVAMKMCNFASQDLAVLGRGRKSLQNLSSLDVQVWEEYRANPESLIFESESVAADLEGRTVEERADIEAEVAALPEGEERSRLVKVRANSAFFRRTVFSAYGGRCCITGLAVQGLLNACHIVPWSANVREGLNPRNGLCMNVLHHKAFDLGLITVTPDGMVKVSPRLVESARSSARAAFVVECDRRGIDMPERFEPGRSFLEYHNREIFERI